MIAAFGPLVIVVVMVALCVVASRVTPDERASGVLGALLPTASILLLYGVLAVATFLPMTGFRRFLPVQLLSYVLTLPWYALKSYATPTGDVVTLSVIFVSLAIPVVTATYLYLLAATLVALGRAASQ